MTNRTFPNRHRAVQKLQALGYLMATPAEGADACFGEQKPVVAAVRVMALLAVSILQRFMNMRSGCLIQMTETAKVSTSSGRYKSMLSYIIDFMA
jgi:hypothetical protein